MIAFASVFLMKLTTKWNRIMGLSVDPGYILQLSERMIALMKSSITSDRHLLRYIASGLEKMLAKSQACTPGIGSNETPASSRSYATPFGFSMPSQAISGMSGGQMLPFPDDTAIMDNGWIQETFGSDSTNDVYNLLASQFGS